MAVQGSRVFLACAVTAVLGVSALGTWRALRHTALSGAPVPVVHVRLSPAALDPAVVLLRPGPVRFAIRNTAEEPIRFRIDGPGVHATTDALAPGSLHTLEVTLTRPGTYTLEETPRGGAPLTGVLAVRP